MARTRIKPRRRREGKIKTSVKSGNFRPTKSGAGMTRKGVMAYRRANPRSKLQTAVTEKKPTGKRAARQNTSSPKTLALLKIL
jgi:hypothetical protein